MYVLGVWLKWDPTHILNPLISLKVLLGVFPGFPQQVAEFRAGPWMGVAQNQPGGVTQVLVHVSTYQGNPFWYRLFGPQPDGFALKLEGFVPGSFFARRCGRRCRMPH